MEVLIRMNSTSWVICFSILDGKGRTLYYLHMFVLFWPKPMMPLWNLNTVDITVITDRDVRTEET